MISYWVCKANLQMIHAMYWDFIMVHVTSVTERIYYSD